MLNEARFAYNECDVALCRTFWKIQDKHKYIKNEYALRYNNTEKINMTVLRVM